MVYKLPINFKKNPFSETGSFLRGLLNYHCMGKLRLSRTLRKVTKALVGRLKTPECHTLHTFAN